LSESPVPIEVRRHGAAGELAVRWSDGHAAVYDYDYLRGFCPCAACQGHTASEIRFHPPASALELLAIQPVGNYALSFRWSDGHATGIYRFEFLRQICPCPQCRQPAPAQAS